MNNIKRIMQSLPEQEYDAILLTDPVNRLFATGFRSGNGVLLITERKAWFYTDSRYFEAAGAAITGADVLPVSIETTYADCVKSVLAEHGITSIGLEDTSLTYAKYLDWEQRLGIKPIPVNKLLSDLRVEKSADDLDQLKKTQRIAEKSFEEILPLIHTGITEKQLAAELQYRFLKNGADDKSFDTIIVSGSKSSMPHGEPEEIIIGRGFLTIDFGARMNGWCSDTTRTLCVGKPDEEMIKVYDTVLQAQEAGIKAARAGIEACEVDAAARTVIENAGYGECFGHGFGHGIGLEVHEAPTVAKSSKDVLPAGAVISAEPGIYLPGRYGVRIEDVLYITETGCENITNLPKELIVL